MTVKGGMSQSLPETRLPSQEDLQVKALPVSLLVEVTRAIRRYMNLNMGPALTWVFTFMALPPFNEASHNHPL